MRDRTGHGDDLGRDSLCTSASGGGVTIASAAAADADQIGRIRVAANGYGLNWAAPQTARLLARPEVSYFVARVEGEPAGCAALIRLGPYAVVDHVATLPECQGRGLASGLIRWLQAASDRPLLLQVVNTLAERIYAKAGFVKQGEIAETMCTLFYSR